MFFYKTPRTLLNLLGSYRGIVAPSLDIREIDIKTINVVYCEVEREFLEFFCRSVWVCIVL